MKVLLVNGSPNAKGCTFTALSEVAKTLGENGIDTEIVHVGHKQIHGCIGCYKCMQTAKCSFDDIVNDVAPKFEEADGIIIGSPVYYASAAGGLVSFLDRLFFSTSAKFPKRMKVGAAVASCRRAGSVATFDMINKYFTMTQMPVVSSQYWNEVHGFTPEDVQKDLEGMQTMRVLGRNMAFMIKSISLGKEKYGLPEEETWVQTNFI